MKPSKLQSSAACLSFLVTLLVAACGGSATNSATVSIGQHTAQNAANVINAAMPTPKVLHLLPPGCSQAEHPNAHLFTPSKVYLGEVSTYTCRAEGFTGWSIILVEGGAVNPVTTNGSTHYTNETQGSFSNINPPTLSWLVTYKSETYIVDVTFTFDTAGNAVPHSTIVAANG